MISGFTNQVVKKLDKTGTMQRTHKVIKLTETVKPIVVLIMSTGLLRCD